MRFSLSREAFLKPLQQVVNVVERRQTLPVLANLLVQVDVDGLRRWWEISGTPITNDQGSFAGYRGVGSDVTERREAHEAVRALAVSIHDRPRAGRLASDSPLDVLMIRYNAAHPVGDAAAAVLTAAHPDVEIFTAAIDRELRAGGAKAGDVAKLQRTRLQSGAAVVGVGRRENDEAGACLGEAGGIHRIGIADHAGNGGG